MKQKPRLMIAPPPMMKHSLAERHTGDRRPARQRLHHRFCGVHRKGHPGRENAAHHASTSPFFRLNSSALMPILRFSTARRELQSLRQSAPPERRQRHASAFGINQHIEIAVDNCVISVPTINVMPMAMPIPIDSRDNAWSGRS